MGDITLSARPSGSRGCREIPRSSVAADIHRRTFPPESRECCRKSVLERKSHAQVGRQAERGESVCRANPASRGAPHPRRLLRACRLPALGPLQCASRSQVGSGRASSLAACRQQCSRLWSRAQSDQDRVPVRGGRAERREPIESKTDTRRRYGAARHHRRSDTGHPLATVLRLPGVPHRRSFLSVGRNRPVRSL